MASGTLLLASNDGKRRNQLAAKLHDFSQRLSSDSRPRSSASSNGHRPSRNGSGPTKSELYELAKKKDVPGRSSMSKEELQKAVQGG